jgi:hypothetical protein
MVHTSPQTKLNGLPLKHMTVTRYTNAVHINNHKWKSGHHGEFKNSRTSTAVGKVEAIYLVHIRSSQPPPFPKRLNLLVMEPCDVLGQEYGGVTLNLSLPVVKRKVVVQMKYMVCKIHVAPHRNPAHQHLRHGVRVGYAM